MKCPRCKNVVLQKSQNGTRLRTKGPIEFTPAGACVAQCYWCGERIAVPLDLRKAERFVVPLGG